MTTSPNTHPTLDQSIAMNILPPDEMLLEYLEGTLPEPEQEVVRQFLARDPALRRRMAGIEKSVTSLRQVQRHELRVRLQQIDRRHRLQRQWLPWIFLLGFFLLAWILLRT